MPCAYKRIVCINVVFVLMLQKPFSTKVHIHHDLFMHVPYEIFKHELTFPWHKKVKIYDILRD